MKQLRAEGHWVERHHGDGTERVGLQDCSAGIFGRFVGIEAKRGLREWRAWKRGHTEQAASQQEVLEEIRAAGAVGLCTWRWQDLRLIIDMIADNKTSAEINATIDLAQEPFLEYQRTPAKRHRTSTRAVDRLLSAVNGH